MNETTHENAAQDNLARKPLLIHFTLEQRYKLLKMANAVRKSQGEFIRLLVEERYVRQALQMPVTLTNDDAPQLDR